MTDPQPLGWIAGLTAADRDWLAEHLALSAIPAPDAPTSRIYLSCGHQMGGPYDNAPGSCATCIAWLATHPAPVRPTAVPAPRRRTLSWARTLRAALTITIIVLVTTLAVVDIGRATIIAMLGLSPLMLLASATTLAITYRLLNREGPRR